jgi:hypothetical protein
VASMSKREFSRLEVLLRVQSGRQRLADVHRRIVQFRLVCQGVDLIIIRVNDGHQGAGHEARRKPR